MGHPHGALFVTAGEAVTPTFVSVTVTEQQAGSTDGGFCDVAHIERISYSVSDCTGAYTITTQIRHALGGADPSGSYNDVETGKSCAAGFSDYSEQSPVNESGSITKKWQARGRIIRTSDSMVMDEVESSVHTITTMKNCTPI